MARAAKRADYLTSELLPDQVLSASGCISDFFPGTWAIEWVSDIFEERLRQASAFLISEHDLPKVLAWTTASFSKEFGWPHTFYRLEAARKARERFVPKVPDVALFGLGLHLSHTEEFLNEARSSPHQPECAPAGQTGVFECVSSGRKITMGGDVRGLSFWLVNTACSRVPGSVTAWKRIVLTGLVSFRTALDSFNPSMMLENVPLLFPEVKLVRSQDFGYLGW